MLLGKRSLGLSLGITFGLIIFLTTLYLIMVDAPGEIISKLSTFFLFYTFTYSGAFIGFVWGFVVGFVIGYFIAMLYNFFYETVGLKYKK